MKVNTKFLKNIIPNFIKKLFDNNISELASDFSEQYKFLSYSEDNTEEYDDEFIFYNDIISSIINDEKLTEEQIDSLIDIIEKDENKLEQKRYFMDIVKYQNINKKQLKTILEDIQNISSKINFVEEVKLNNNLLVNEYLAKTI